MTGIYYDSFSCQYLFRFWTGGRGRGGRGGWSRGILAGSARGGAASGCVFCRESVVVGCGTASAQGQKADCHYDDANSMNLVMGAGESFEHVISLTVFLRAGS